MQTSQLAQEALAERIEQAYSIRRNSVQQIGVDPRVWEFAAKTLQGVHFQEPWIPVDPELYVAAQKLTPSVTGPWTTVAGPAAAQRYRAKVVAIVRQLRRELRGELKQIRRRVLLGKSLDEVLERRCSSISPLARYIAAVSEGRTKFAEHWLAGAREQHSACPLYRRACKGLLSESDYPAWDLLLGAASNERPIPRRWAFSCN